jgi:hypothetical protein
MTGDATTTAGTGSDGVAHLRQPGPSSLLDLLPPSCQRGNSSSLLGTSPSAPVPCLIFDQKGLAHASGGSLVYSSYPGVVVCPILSDRTRIRAEGVRYTSCVSPFSRGSRDLGWGTVRLWMGGFDGEITLPAQAGGTASGTGGERVRGSGWSQASGRPLGCQGSLS